MISLSIKKNNSIKCKKLREDILIIEDSRTMSNILASQIEERLDVKTVVANNYDEAKNLLKHTRTKFGLALINTQLPDSSDGEVLELIKEYEIPAIAIIPSHDEEVEKACLKKGSLEIVYKNNEEDILYAVSVVERIFRNKTTEVLVVDDISMSRTLITTLLSKQLCIVHEADDGEQALALLRENHRISLVITDYQMPKMNGLELVKEARRIYSKEQLAILVVSASGDKTSATSFLKQGANDYIIKPFTKEEFVTRVNVNLENIRKLKAQRLLTHDLVNYKNIVNNNVIISKTDLRGVITEVSQAFCDISGFSKIELIGSGHNIVRHPDMPSSAFEDLWKTIKSGQSWSGQVKNRKKDGGFYWAEAFVSPEYSIYNKHIGYVSVRQDITAQKEVERIHQEQIDEQNLAHEKQKNTIVNDFENSDEYDYRIFYKPSDILSGDIYSLVKLEDGSKLIYILDAMGHGLLPSFTTFAAVSTIKRFIGSSKDLQELLEHLSDSLRTFLGEDEQLSYTFVHIAADHSYIDYANGGMYPTVIETAKGIKKLKANNPPFMSFLAGAKAMRVEEEFKRALIYSDGLVEEEDSRVTKENVEELLDLELLEESLAALEKTELEDDTTVLYFERK
jgi:PAS domain S-box-containing protein